MKKFAKLSMLFALVGFAACTNDTTEDLVNAPTSGEGVTLTATIAEADVRTALGDKTADGKYPLYWSEGDVLSVNGEASAVAIDAENAAAGSFTTTAAAPFNIVYPYIEGLGASVVRFAEVQPHTEGTFAAASAPMYGYAESATAGVAMKHLTGIMRFAITSAEGVKLTAINIEADTAIAGDFAIDCATGELTAQEGKTSTGITYTFAENEGTLSTTASHFYVAVPAGAYGDVSVSFVAEGGKIMLASFNGSNIKAGVVREFQEVPFTDNASEFLIYDEATLLDFAQKVANDSFKPDAARVSASFEVSAETAAAWTPIEGFAKTLNGGGKTISGMTKPLFGALAGTVKNLNIAGAYTATLGSTFGALAVTAAEGALIEGCSLAEGSTITVEGTTAGETKVGGLVGDAVATLKNLANYATITVAAENAEANLAIGGVAGKAFCEIDNCDNYGTLTVGAATLNDLNIGGVVGLLDAKLDTPFNIANCDNSGAVTIGESATSNRLCLGGVAGSETLAIDLAAAADAAYAQTYTFDTCTNKGNMTFRGTIAATGNYFYVGGITGCAFGNYKNCTNGVKDTEQGAVYITGKTLGQTIPEGDIWAYETLLMGFGGIFGGNTGYVYAYSEMDYCVNYAPITCDNLDNQAAINETAMQTIRIGGIFGLRRSANRDVNKSFINNSENYGKITINHIGGRAGLVIGGIGAYCQIFTNNCTNHGAVECNVAAAATLYVGGVYGYNNTCYPTIINNYGNITVKGTQAEGETTGTGTVYIGGIMGSSSWVSYTSSINEGDITVTNYKTTEKFYIGGNIAIKTGTTNHPIPVNKGDITVRGCACVTACIGGIAGDSEGAIDGDNGVYDGSSDYVMNSGTIDVEMTATGNYYIAGGTAYSDGKAFIGLKNTGNIISNSKVTGISRIGGIFSYTLRHTKQYTHKYLVNEGNITITGEQGDDVYVGGCMGEMQSNNTTTPAYAQKLQHLSNTGDISINLSSSGSAIVAAGAVGSAHNNVDEIHNTGNVTVRGKSGDTCYAGGSVSICNLTTAVQVALTGASAAVANTNITNSGKVDVELTDSDVSLCIGGALAYAKSGVKNLSNSGEVVCNGTGATVRVGGGLGYLPDIDFNSNLDVFNTAAVSCGTTSTAAAYVGGAVGVAASTLTNVKNEGPVTYTGSTTSVAYVGGAAGSCGTCDQGYYENAATGVVKVDGAQVTKYLCVGGCMGIYTLHLKQGGTNYATVEITRNTTTGQEIMIGGCVGCVNAGNAKTLKDLINYGSVICSGETEQDCYVGGVLGYAASRNAGAKYTLTNLTNNADRVRVNSTVARDLYLGGIIGASDAVGSESGHTLGVNTVVEIGGGASVGGTTYQTDEYIGLIEADFLIHSLR